MRGCFLFDIINRKSTRFIIFNRKNECRIVYMTVYIECVIIDNFSVTLLCSLLAYRFSSVSASKLRCLLASLVGTAAAVFYPLLRVPAVVLILIKFALCAALSFILFFKKCNVIKGAASLLTVTFFLGGIMFAIGYITYADVVKALTLPVSSIPIGVFIIGFIVAYFALRRAVMHIKRIKDAKNFIANTEITAFSKTFKSKGFLDTGNRLYDDKTGLPVVILNFSAALRLLDNDKLSALLSKRGEDVGSGAHYIEFSSVGGQNNQILVFQPDEIRLYFGQTEHKIKDVMIGISLSRFGDCTDYDVILHPAII